MKTIVYELNEVPKKLFDFYSDAFPKSAFAKLRSESDLFQTNTADVGHLSPWITWPTMHRGVSNVDHQISDLGQDLTDVNFEFPPIWEILARSGVKVGVFGSLQSYPLPKNLDNYDFYVPDTFAAGSECYPSTISDFQAFNLSMVKANGRNVSSGVAIRDASRFLLKAPNLGLSWPTTKKLGFQLIQERIQKDRVVRRRTSQVEIAFDIYFEQLTRNKPDVSFFFTNHVASSMHRYWPTVFPKDYAEGKFDSDWLVRWKHEIPHAVNVANYQLEKLIEFCDTNDHRLIVASSMGQNAVQDVEPIRSQVLITDIKKLLSYLGITQEMWEPRLSMAPRIVIKPLVEGLMNKLERLNSIDVNGVKISFFQTSTGDIRFKISLTNAEEIFVNENSIQVDPKQLGLSNVDLQDASGSYAFHIPQGILINYEPESSKKQNSVKKWKDISVLDLAPSFLRQFGKSSPSYMKGDSKLF